MENSAIETLLAELDGQGIYIYVQDGRLKLRSRQSEIPPQKLALIREHKQALIAYMQRHHQKVGKLSRAQQRIWFIEQYETQLNAYNMAGLLRLSKAYSAAQIESALNVVLQRYDVLRSQFMQQDGEVVQSVNRDAKLTLQVQSLAGDIDCEAAAKKVQDELSYQFDLESELLVRARLLVAQDQGQWLYVCMHHIVADGWSVRLFTQSLIDELAGQAEAQKTLQYLDFVHWENKYQQSSAYQQQLSYWQQQLADLSVFELPTSVPREAHKQYQGAKLEASISQPLAQRFSTLCQQLGVTPFAGYLGVFYALLHRYGQAEDITLGVPVLNRTQAEFEQVVGCFINTLPMRARLHGQQSLAQILTHTHQLVKAGLDHQSVAVEEIIDALDLAKSTAHSALFQILFNYNGIAQRVVRNDELSAELFDLDNHTAKYDLTLSITDDHDGIQLSLDYAKQLFDARFVQQFTDDYTALIDMACRSTEQVIGQISLPSSLPILGAAQLNDAPVSVIEGLYHSAQRHPERTALIQENAESGQAPSVMSYDALITQLEGVALRLYALHQPASSPITLLVQRDIKSLIWMLGAMRAGIAYLPIDAATPAERISEIMSQAGSQRVLCASEHLAQIEKLQEDGIDVLDISRLYAQSAQQSLPNMPLGEDIAYVMFTSGSTGKPKGAVISHHALARYVAGVSERVRFTQETRSAVVTGLATDLGLTGIFPVLIGAGSVLLCDSTEPELLVKACHQHDVNLIKLTPSFAQALLPWLQQSTLHVEQWILGGEALSLTLVQQLRNLTPDARLFNHYGPTEACIGVCTFEIPTEHDLESIPIGAPFNHIRFAILDAQQQPVCAGVPGELYIGGESLANGYINAAKVTEDAFVSLKVGDGDSARYYRTGDQVKCNFDGQVEFLGRLDKQLKINGFRVDIAEVECKLQTLEQVQEVAVICRQVAQQNMLVGYFVPDGKRTELTQCESAIRQQLKQQLPAHMIPAYLIQQASLPKLNNGKIDRRALESLSIEISDATRAPQTALHHQLLDIFSTLTGCSGIGIDHSFFAIGGHSLLAMRLLNEVKAQCGVSLSLKHIFANPSIAELALCMESQDAQVEQLPVRSIAKQDSYSLSFAQQRIWFIDQMQGHSEQYHLQGAYHITGELNCEQLKRAFCSVVQAHPMLRFTFHQDTQGTAYQKDNADKVFALNYDDLSAYEGSHQQRLIDDIVTADTKRGFDLSVDLMLRATLVKCTQTSHMLLITMHHIISDGWSIAVLADALSRAYQASEQQNYAIEAPQFTYLDFIDWQRRVSDTEKWQASLDYWREALAEIPQVHALPTDRARSNEAVQGGELACFELPNSLKGAMHAFCQHHGCTRFQVLKTAFSMWMSRAQQQRDIVIATPVSGREMQAFEPVIGNFINTLVLRDKFTTGTQFNEALQGSQAQFLAAQAHQVVPFDVLVEALEVPRNLAIHPLAQVVFRVNTEVNETLQLQDLEVQLIPQTARSAKLDLEVCVIDDAQTCCVEWLFDTALWDLQSMADFHAQYLWVLEQCLDNPDIALSQLTLWRPAVSQAFIRASQSIEVVNSEVTSWATQFSQVAHKSPQRTALSFAAQSWCYEEVDRITNQLAHCLLEMAFEPQTRIALLLPEGPLTVIAMLGVLKAEHVYVPLHHDTPVKTLEHVIVDADVMLTLAFSESADKLIKAGSDFLLLDDALSEDSILSSYPDTAPDINDLPACEIPLSARDCYIIYTSGSTGQPKGVPINHSNLQGYLHHAMSSYMMPEPQHSVMSTPAAFDATVTAIVPTLMSGGSLTILPQGVSLIPELIDKLWAKQASLFKLTPAHLRAVLSLTDDKPICETLHRLIVGGEALQSDLVIKFREKLPNCHIVNEYGPTESTVGVSVFDIPTTMSQAELASAPDVPIGSAIEGVTLLVVDEFDQPVARNMAGELLIAGSMVSQGYVNQAELTAKKFTLRAITANHMQSVYRSGDVVKWQLDAHGAPKYLRYLGRTDEQVKLRGYRIDLDAVSQFILAIEGIVDCALTIDDNAQTLIAHVLWQTETKLSARQLRQQLTEVLPSYMIPAAFHTVAVMPLTANGKVDKAALIASYEATKEDTAQSNVVAQYAELTAQQKTLMALYQAILPTASIGLEDSFFELGGHSLLAIKLISQIRQQMQVDITLPQLFRTPSVQALADALPSFERLATGDEIPVVARTHSLPLSFSQQRLWLIDQLQNGSSQYHMPASFVFKGELDLFAFNAALESIIARHEVLRSIILPGASNESPEQLIKDQVEVPLIYEDISMLDESDKCHREDQLKAQFCQKAFDLSQDVMLRVTVIKREPQCYWVHFNMHHIASDGWSMAILVKEIIAFYRHHKGEVDYQLPDALSQPLAVQYADFAHWQRAHFTPDKQQVAIDYWRQQLAGSPPIHQLPLDFARPKVQALAAKQFKVKLNEATTAAIKNQCQTESVTLFMWLHSAFSLLMMRMSGVDDIAIGSPVAGRTQKQLNELIGFFVNTVVIRAQAEKHLTFNQYLAQQKAVIVDAFKHQSLPFEQVVEALNPERSLSHQPLFQVLFALQNNEVVDIALPDLHIEETPLESLNLKFDLEVNAIEQGAEIELEWRFSCALFKQSTIAAMAEAFNVLIDAALNGPDWPISRLAILSSEQQRALAKAAGHICEHDTPVCLHERFENVVYMHKEKVAVTDAEGSSLSYEALWQRAGSLASHLLANGVNADDKLAVCLSPSADMVVALLAVLRAGCAYVPIDPKLPAARIQYILQDSGAAGVISSDDLIRGLANLSDSIAQSPLTLFSINDSANWPASCDQGVLPKPHVDALAYVIYTSGTTGQPKGVQISHQNLHHYVSFAIREYTNSTLSRAIVSTPVAFDATVTTLWGGLLAGLGIELIDDNDTLLAELAKRLFSHESYLLKVTPAHLKGALEVANQLSLTRQFSGRHCVVIGGEALSCQLLKALDVFLPNTQWVNEYGPTEATVGTSIYRCDSQTIEQLIASGQNDVPIGQAMPYSHCVVLDELQQFVPNGVLGELYVSGDAISAGYLGKSKLTDEKFITLSLQSTAQAVRFYRTGDKAKWQFDEASNAMQLRFAGRIDQQVKLRGYRIELDEIAHYLVQQAEIKEAQVLLNDKGDNIEAFVVLENDGQTVSLPQLVDEIRGIQYCEQLALQLPTYMLPHRFIQVTHLPLTNNGKLDTHSLRSWAQQCQSKTEVVVPSSELEKALHQIFATVLAVDEFGITDNFFTLGGHSLLAIQCAGLIQEQLSIAVPMRVLFERPTITALVKWIRIHTTYEQAQLSDSDSSEEMFL
ncbi:non-ribosomal peptide synthetase [Pseudoalteromonas umbrosa]|uniref:non-ribosomal peptide synthetase n=1 Tax=Pseudoalteromonas umbrosa TaxID=3048489 RepID=UPI0024C353FD|nr:non-ribosomal peptide synthetase [Pseudoalteromonas sp. B95]MDK1289025.1 amino acid adenylation domain-containing protein [Pseudoalteromonas sp. B95]